MRLPAHNRAFTLEGFSPQISLVQEQRTSNAKLHDYDGPAGELGFVLLFWRMMQRAPEIAERAGGIE